MSDFSFFRGFTAHDERFHRYWISDEYGPYIYRYTAAGALIQTIQPPAAVLPIISGALDFTSVDDPDTGRAANQGTGT